MRPGNWCCATFRSATAADRVAFPDNPNGSMGHVAGLCDASGRVLGLMPHPERHIDPTQHPRWTRGEAAAGGRRPAGLRQRGGLLPLISRRRLLAASTMFRSEACTSGQARVFSPQSGFTQSWSGRSSSSAFRSRPMISSTSGTRGLWMS